jgi:hypothetical protein
MPAAAAAPAKTARSEKATEPTVVERLLASGKTSKIDPATGRSQAIYAKCPTDEAPSGVRRVNRGNGGSITEVTMRCPRCASDFVAATSALYLN